MASDGNGRHLARLRLAGILVLAGLAIELLTLAEVHPLAFVTFVIGGAALVVAGVAALVWALAAR